MNTIVTYAKGDAHTECLEITRKYWQIYAAKIGAEFVEAPVPPKLRPGFGTLMLYKLQVVLALRRKLGSVVWVDADIAPLPQSPDIFLEEVCEGEVLGIPIDEPCPHAIETRAGIFRVTGSVGFDIIETAAAMLDVVLTVGYDELALGLAAGFKRRGLRLERPAPFKLPIGITRLSKDWLADATSPITPRTKMIHSYGAGRAKAPILHAAVEAAWRNQNGKKKMNQKSK